MESGTENAWDEATDRHSGGNNPGKEGQKDVNQSHEVAWLWGGEWPELAGAECGREMGNRGQLRVRAQPQQGDGSRCECDWEPTSAFKEEGCPLGYFL